MRSTEGQTRLRHPSSRSRAQGEGDPEVRYHRPSVVQQNVLGLNVPMYNAPLQALKMSQNDVDGFPQSGMVSGGFAQ